MNSTEKIRRHLQIRDDLTVALLTVVSYGLLGVAVISYGLLCVGLWLVLHYS